MLAVWLHVCLSRISHLTFRVITQILISSDGKSFSLTYIRPHTSTIFSVSVSYYWQYNKWYKYHYCHTDSHTCCQTFRCQFRQFLCAWWTFMVYKIQLGNILVIFCILWIIYLLFSTRRQSSGTAFLLISCQNKSIVLVLNTWAVENVAGAKGCKLSAGTTLKFVKQF